MSNTELVGLSYENQKQPIETLTPVRWQTEANLNFPDAYIELHNIRVDLEPANDHDLYFEAAINLTDYSQKLGSDSIIHVLPIPEIVEITTVKPRTVKVSSVITTGGALSALMGTLSLFFTFTNGAMPLHPLIAAVSVIGGIGFLMMGALEDKINNGPT